MWMILFLLILQAGGGPCTPAPCPAEAPAPTPNGPPWLIVQAVDPAWSPVSNGEVTVKPQDGKGSALSSRTDSDGYAKYWLPREGEYSIEVKAPGFKKKRIDHVRVTASTAYVQMQLKIHIPAGQTVTVY